jgi:hypothetical protein
MMTLYSSGRTTGLTLGFFFLIDFLYHFFSPTFFFILGFGYGNCWSSAYYEGYLIRSSTKNYDYG